MARFVAPVASADPAHIQDMCLAINGALAGETLNTGTFISAAGTITIEDPRCRTGRLAVLVPLDAAAAAQTWYLSSMTRGSMSFTLTGDGTGSWAWLIFGNGD